MARSALHLYPWILLPRILKLCDRIAMLGWILLHWRQQ